MLTAGGEGLDGGEGLGGGEDAGVVFDVVGVGEFEVLGVVGVGFVDEGEGEGVGGLEGGGGGRWGCG